MLDKPRQEFGEVDRAIHVEETHEERRANFVSEFSSHSASCEKRVCPSHSILEGR